MRKFITTFSFILLLAQAAITNAGELKTVTLAVDGMTCDTCPITVKKALKNVDGVTDVVAKYEGHNDGWARVTFDSDKVKIDDLTFATEEAGYPSHPNP